MDTTQLLKDNGILWEVTEFSNRHPLLTSGLHSDCYFNSARLFERHDVLARVLAAFDTAGIQRAAARCGSVCGLQTGGMILAYLLPTMYKVFQDKCIVYTDKSTEHRLTRWRISELTPPILIVDDVITTGTSISKFVSHYPIDLFQGDIICLVNRTGASHVAINGKVFNIIAAVTLQAQVWSAEECPLCKQGSIAIRPKEHWGQ